MEVGKADSKAVLVLVLLKKLTKMASRGIQKRIVLRILVQKREESTQVQILYTTDKYANESKLDSLTQAMKFSFKNL